MTQIKHIAHSGMLLSSLYSPDVGTLGVNAVNAAYTHSNNDKRVDTDNSSHFPAIKTSSRWKDDINASIHKANF